MISGRAAVPADVPPTTTTAAQNPAQGFLKHRLFGKFADVSIIQSTLSSPRKPDACRVFKVLHELVVIGIHRIVRIEEPKSADPATVCCNCTPRTVAARNDAKEVFFRGVVSHAKSGRRDEDNLCLFAASQFNELIIYVFSNSATTVQDYSSWLFRIVRGRKSEHGVVRVNGKMSTTSSRRRRTDRFV